MNPGTPNRRRHRSRLMESMQSIEKVNSNPRACDRSASTSSSTTDATANVTQLIPENLPILVGIPVARWSSLSSGTLERSDGRSFPHGLKFKLKSDNKVILRDEEKRIISVCSVSSNSNTYKVYSPIQLSSNQTPSRKSSRRLELYDWANVTINIEESSSSIYPIKMKVWNGETMEFKYCCQRSNVPTPSFEFYRFQGDDDDDNNNNHHDDDIPCASFVDSTLAIHAGENPSLLMCFSFIINDITEKKKQQSLRDLAKSLNEIVLTSSESGNHSTNSSNQESDQKYPIIEKLPLASSPSLSSSSSSSSPRMKRRNSSPGIKV